MVDFKAVECSSTDTADEMLDAVPAVGEWELECRRSSVANTDVWYSSLARLC